MKIFSFFSGCGILDLGFENAGFKIEFVNEFFKPFYDAYAYSRKKMGIPIPTYGYANTDVNVYLNENKTEMEKYMLDARKDGSLVGFIGGPPCPDFSIAGKQKGRDGDNGKLSLLYINLILAMNPEFFLFENVKGLWKTARHREFYEELKQMLKGAGYCLTERLTNSLEFGVPQDRDRILLIGIKKEIVCDEYTTASQDLVDFPWNARIKYPLENIKAMPWPDMDQFEVDSVRSCPDGIQKELTVEYWFEKNDVENHPDAQRYFKPKAGLKKMLEISEGDTNKKSYKRIHRWRYSPTVAYGNNEVHLHPYKARRLAVSEAMALQSLPKEFVLPPEMTLTDCFKTIGNGVPYMMAQGVALTLKDYLNLAVKDNEEGVQ
ncbi:DNA cytosine methyltransferase [[Ruminococcus] gnavus]|nr:DNA cytosine methyltransferase [Mediterraneibacter gnavus]MDB8715006.1 DNA cytosine methyltransferase [Mediterraneibacter gnavus]